MNIQIGHDAALVESKKKLISGTYMRNAWYVAAWSETVGDGGVLGLTILKEPVMLYRQSNGEVAALADRCAHRFAPLSMGHVIGGNRIQCPYHGLEYDKTGACVLNPHGNKNIPSRARVNSYPVFEKHKAIWVWMGDQPADPSKIPDFSVKDNAPELHTTKLDKIMVKANYELVIDNLLDLSHTSYLHAGILGNADTVESDIGVDQDGDDIVVALRPRRRAAGHEQADVAGCAFEGRQVHPHPLDGAVDPAARDRCVPARRGAGTGQRLSRSPYPDAGNRRDHALFLHGGALRHFQQGRRAEPADPGEDRRHAPVRLRGSGCACDRGAAAHHRRRADHGGPADVGD